MSTGKTLEEVKTEIRIAGDSVFVVNDEIKKLNESGKLTEEGRGNIDRNVQHLKIVVGDEAVIESEENIEHLKAAIILGEQTLADNTEETEE